MGKNDPFVFGDDDDNGDSIQVDDENVNFTQLRGYAKKLERERNALRKELEPLRELKVQVDTEKKVAAVSEVFKASGLDVKHAKLWTKLNPDAEATADAIAEFAEEYGLPKATDVVEDKGTGDTADAGIQSGTVLTISDPPEKSGSSSGLAPTQGSTAPGAHVITDIDEAEKLLLSNPNEYVRLREAGRIKLDKLPGSEKSLSLGA